MNNSEVVYAPSMVTMIIWGGLFYRFNKNPPEDNDTVPDQSWFGIEDSKEDMHKE